MRQNNGQLGWTNFRTAVQNLKKLNENMVPRGGIEPPTRGFSILLHWQRNQPLGCRDAGQTATKNQGLSGRLDNFRSTLPTHYVPRFDDEGWR